MEHVDHNVDRQRRGGICLISTSTALSPDFRESSPHAFISVITRAAMDSEAIPIEAPFAASFPLPFRVLVLAGAGILCWATNLHGLHFLGVDAASALEFRSQDSYGYAHSAHSLRHSLTNPNPPDSLALARAIYRLCISYAFVVFSGWAIFRVEIGRAHV